MLCPPLYMPLLTDPSPAWEAGFSHKITIKGSQIWILVTVYTKACLWALGFLGWGLLGAVFVHRCFRWRTSWES